MPLLQGQPFRLIKPPANLQPDQEVYIIQHTGEKFIGKSDYEDRLALYSQSIWSCQCTGKSGLTHQEAWTSEQKVRVQLEGSFPSPLRGPILSIVHQSTAPLDQLVEAANIHCNARFHRGEELELKSPQPIKVKVVKVHKGKGEAASPQKHVGVNGTENSPLTNGCSTPGISTLNGNGTTENGCSSSSSPNDGTKGKEDSPSKKMLPYLYDVAIIGDDRTVTEVPAEHLHRVTKIPPKEHFRLFVRANAIRPRASSTTPWMVREDLVRQYNIPCKLPSIFNMKPQSQKRKAEEPLVGEIIKKPKEELKPQPAVEVKPKPILSPIQVIESSEQKIRKKPGPKLGSKHSPKKVDESEDSKIPKKRGPKPGSKRTPKMNLTSYFTKTEDVTEIKVEKIKVENGPVPVKSPMTKAKGETPDKKRGRPKMKQASLFDIKAPNKRAIKSPQGSLKKSPVKKSPVKKRAITPEAVMNLPIMRKLIHEHKHLKGVKGSGRKLVYTMDLAIKKLNREQILVIPNESLREDLLTRQAKVIEQKILADMSPEDKEEYLKQKSKDEAERRRLAKSLENMKVEDKNLNDLKPLPQPKMVPTPEVIPNSLFGDIVMVTEFLQCYRDLLMPDDDINLSTSQLMEALAAGPNGFKATADIFCILLRTIIRDETSKNIKELKVPLRDLPVTYQTATELARQFLRRQDPEEKEKDDAEKDDEDEEEEEEYEEEIELSDELINKLEENELFELEITEIIAMLKALCHRVMTTNAVAEFFDDLEEKLNKLNRENASIKRMKKKEILDEKERKKEERQLKKNKKQGSPKKGRGRPKGSSPKKSPTKPIINSFYKKSLNGEEDTDMASRVKRKRKSGIEKEQEKQEERTRIREERERHQQELDIIARVKYNENLARRCEEMLSKKELVNRQQPLGIDRDHNRYWLFHDTTTGLFVEKGWVDSASMYSVSPEFTETLTPMKHNSDDESVDVKEELAADSPKKLQAIREPGTRGRPKLFIEDVNALTIPAVGQNLWFYFNTMEEVDALINSLADKGLRESQLKEALIKNKEKIEANLLQKWEPLGEEDLQDGRQQIMATVKDDIIQIEREVIEGWFGAVPNYDDWEKKTNEAETIQDLGRSLMEVQKHMQKKFFKNFMKPISGVMNSVVNAETDQQIGELEECEPRAVQRWRTEVENCQTFSRLHMLVGMFDSCIRWEKSMATKKCKICRSKDKSDPLVLCEKCEGSYHWYCLRPQLWEEPAAPWFCSACAPKKSKRVDGKIKEEVLGESEEENSEEEETKQEEVCRICVGRMGLIFCSTCPAAYHSECHTPPLTSRARKDWKCVDCVKNPPKPKPERKPNSIAKFFEKSKSKKSSGSKKRQSYSMDDSDEEELDKKSNKKKKSSKHTRSGRSSKRAQRFGDDSDEDGDESLIVSSRRSSRNPSARKRYNESEEEEDEDEAEEEEEQEGEEAEEEEEEGGEEEEGDEDEEGDEKEDDAEEKEDNQEEGSDEEDAEQDDDDDKEEQDDDDKEDTENEDEEKEEGGEDEEEKEECGEDEEEKDEGANEESEQSNATSDED